MRPPNFLVHRRLHPPLRPTIRKKKKYVNALFLGMGIFSGTILWRISRGMLRGMSPKLRKHMQSYIIGNMFYFSYILVHFRYVFQNVCTNSCTQLIFKITFTQHLFYLVNFILKQLVKIYCIKTQY